MSGYEDASLTEIEAVLDGLEGATSSQVYYATKGYQARAVAAVAASRADAPAGASFPDEWTVGDDGTLLIELSANANALSIESPQGGSRHLRIGSDISDPSLYYVETAARGEFNLHYPHADAANLQARIGADVGRLELSDSTGDYEVEMDVGVGVARQFFVSTGGQFAFAVKRTGDVVISRVAAAADGDLTASEMAIWLDATPAATKLMVKAKDSGGTVRTGSINLT